MSNDNGSSEESGDRRDARQLIASELDGFLTSEQTRAMLDQILAIEKPVHHKCPKCNAWSTAKIPDAKAVVSAMADLLTQAKGRPTDQKVEQSLVINRTVVLADEESDRLRGLASDLIQALEGAGEEKDRLERWRTELASSTSG